MNAMEALKQKLTERPFTPEVAAGLVADRCRREPELAGRMRKDARGCLEELSGRQLPEDVKIIVHDNTDDSWHLPLPNHTQSIELSEDRLQKIAAGEFIISMGASISISVVVAAFALVISASLGGVGYAIYETVTD